jgi:uncharacterized protein YoxC
MVLAMAQRKSQKDLLTRLSDVGEEALSRVAGSPATTRVLDTVGGMKERLDDVQKKVRGLDALEKRVAKLERRVEELSKPKRSPAAPRARAATTKRTTTRSTPRKKPPT